jgi:hypothetical protein
MFLSGIKWLKEILLVEISNEANAPSPFPISRILFTLNSFHKATQSTKLITWKY